jgi:integrase
MSLRQDFTRYLEVRNYAPTTVGAYLRHVEGLAWHYHRPPDRISHHEIQHYLLYLAKTRRYAWNTIHGIVFGLRAFFFGFLRRPETDFIIPIPKLPKRLPLVWSPAEIARLIEAAPEPRTRVMIQLGYGTGMRLFELCQLARRHLDPGHRTIWVRGGKGRKTERRSSRSHSKPSSVIIWKPPLALGGSFLRPRTPLVMFPANW